LYRVFPRRFGLAALQSTERGGEGAGEGGSVALQPGGGGSIVFLSGLHGAAEAVDRGVMQRDGLGGEHGLHRRFRVEGLEQRGGGFEVLCAAGEGAGEAGEEGLEEGG
jgi:hypothetical protein